MAKLFHIDRTREGSFLRAVSLQLKEKLSQRDITGSDVTRPDPQLTSTSCFSFSTIYAVTGGWWLCKSEKPCYLGRCRSASVYSAALTHLTCSLISRVSPTSPSSSHFPRNNSPKKGFNGFFSVPSFSLRLQYCWWSVLRNHFRTSNARF